MHKNFELWWATMLSRLLEGDEHKSQHYSGYSVIQCTYVCTHNMYVIQQNIQQKRSQEYKLCPELQVLSSHEFLY